MQQLLTGPDDDTIEQMRNALDADDDWWAVIAAAISGDLVVQVDCDLNLEGRQACMRYHCITGEMLVTRYTPFSKYMNDYIRENLGTLVFVPASVLVAQDRKIGQKLLDGLHDQTMREVRNKARVIAARQMNITHSGHPYVSAVDIVLATLRLGFKPDLDKPRKKKLIERFTTRPKHYLTIDELETLFRETENEFSELSSDGRTYHNDSFTEQLETWLDWLRDRTWAEKWIQDTTVDNKWPSTFSDLVEMTKTRAQFESVETERAVYRDLYPDSQPSQVFAIGTRDAKVAQSLHDRARKPQAYTAKPYDRRHAVARGSSTESLHDRERDSRDRDRTIRHDRQSEKNRQLTRQQQIRPLTRSNKYTLGKVIATPDTPCPLCNKLRCRGRCWCCLKPGTCADPPKGHLARDCKFANIGFEQTSEWDPEWRRHHFRDECLKCGNVGHPPHACPERISRKVLIRLVKELDSGRWVNNIVAFCTLKPGKSEPEHGMIDSECYDIEYTSSGQYTGCVEECGPAGCGKTHEVSISHVYKPEQRLSVPQISTPDFINLVRRSDTSADDEVDHEMHEIEHEEISDDEAFRICPVFCRSIDHDEPGDMLVASNKSADDRTLWDTGAEFDLRQSVAGARGYIRGPARKLNGAQGVEIKSDGEATFESLHVTDRGSPHTLVCDASICPQAPNIASAGAKFAAGYGAVHNIDGIFVPRQSRAYDRVLRSINKQDAHMLFNADEHWVITPEMEKIALHRERNLLYLHKVQPTSAEETEHLKDSRIDPRYTVQDVHMIRMNDAITHDCTLPHYVTEIQKIVGDYESLSRQVAHYGAHDDRLSELMIATMTHLHDMQHSLEQPDLNARHMQSVDARIATVEQTALKHVCNRCRQHDCPTVFDSMTQCTRKCYTCGTTSSTHENGFECGRSCAEHPKITVMTEHAQAMLRTDLPEEDDGAELTREHASAHAYCDTHPCKACREAPMSSSTESTVHTQTSPNLGNRQQIPIAMPVDTVPILYDHLNDPAIIGAFQSLTLGTTVQDTTTQTSPVSESNKSLNSAGVCHKCRKHYTGCKCRTPAQQKLHDRKWNNGTDTKPETVVSRVRQSETADPFAAIDFDQSRDPFEHIDHDSCYPARSHYSQGSGDAVPTKTAGTYANAVPGSGDAMPEHGRGDALPQSAQASAASDIGWRCHRNTHAADPPAADCGDAGSKAETSTAKRKEELSTHEMLQLVHANAWMHVMDAAHSMDKVLNMPAELWLTILPRQDQAMLAVHFQNELHATVLLSRDVAQYGHESAQTGRSARRLHDIRYRKTQHLALCMRRAEVILSSGTSQ